MKKFKFYPKDVVVFPQPGRIFELTLTAESKVIPVFTLHCDKLLKYQIKNTFNFFNLN